MTTFSNKVHVVPVNDLKEHDEIGFSCWCDPKIIDEDSGFVVVHNSLDGRENYE